MCYAEQDRCVVPEYADVKEEFFPDCALPHTTMTRSTGGVEK